MCRFHRILSIMHQHQWRSREFDFRNGQSWEYTAVGTDLEVPIAMKRWIFMDLKVVV